jgi:hypothetical protein
MKNLNTLVDNATRDAIRKKGFASAQIIYEWEQIVGPFLAKNTTPLKITYPINKNVDGTLHIQVISAQAPIIQTLEVEIIEKIATYFGFKAVQRIKLIHGSNY